MCIIQEYRKQVWNDFWLQLIYYAFTQIIYFRRRLGELRGLGASEGSEVWHSVLMENIVKAKSGEL